MSAASEIRLLADQRCNVEEIAIFLGSPRWYVRHVLREWGYMRPTPGSYPDTAAKIRCAMRPRLFAEAA